MANETETLKTLHKALINLNKRAERASNEILVSNFVDSEPLFDLLSTHNNQVIYGLRGTGKTHALKYLAETVGKSGDHAVYIDLRSIGSNSSIYSDTTRSLADRASTLIVDVLGAVHDELLSIAISVIDRAPNPEQVTTRIDDLAAAITAVRIVGPIEEERGRQTDSLGEGGVTAKLSVGAKPGAELGVSLSAKSKADTSYRRKRSGPETIHLDFGTINAALVGLIQVVNSPRIWLLIDEWSEIPIDLQPYLADLIRRTILPINEITVKIASIEHRSQFNILHDRGEYTGVELGADMSADLNLDDFLVFDNDQGKAVEFKKA
jgi:Cdc6-like AAA superfamily ATPase